MVLSESSIYRGYTFEKNQIKVITAYAMLKLVHERNVIKMIHDMKDIR